VPESTNKPAGSARSVTNVRAIGGMIVDHTPTKRVRSHEDMSPWALLCAAAGRHLGFMLNEPRVADVDGWGEAAREVRYRCECTRWKYEVVDAEGRTMSRSVQYGGGELLIGGGRGEQAHAKKVWLDRVQERRDAAIRKADADAAQQEGGAVAEHKASVAKKAPAKPRRSRRKTGTA
jgi:hypothetical protein